MSDTLVLSIHVQATPETVFRFLSDPELFKQWMGPGASLGPASVEVNYPSGQTARGALRESVAGERIVFGWGYVDNTHGLAPDSTTVTIQLTPTATGTTVTLTHSGLTPAQQSEHSKGWTHYLGQLATAATSLAAVVSLPITVDNYIQAWNENSEEARAARLDACWDENGIFRDSMGAVDGRAALFAYIGNARNFVPHFQLELGAPPEHCHGYYRFSWVIRLPDGNIMARGTNFGQLAPSGRIASAIGFWDKP